MKIFADTSQFDQTGGRVEQMNIKKDKEIIERVRSVIDRWSYYAADAGIPQKQTNAIGSVHLLEL
ncbi:MAG: hypothetical protein NTX61_08635 [Bacteroidetes bacterium]|nr:hypothetical protein [Bacteroidota bacterium]